MATNKKKITVERDLLAVHAESVSLTQAIMLILFDDGLNSTEVRESLDTDRVLMSINIRKLRLAERNILF